jgi:type II secretory pathway component PulJ
MPITLLPYPDDPPHIRVISPSSYQVSRGEQGFTLIEMLVTLMTGVVIVLAAFAILDVSLTQSSRISERVEVDQRARLAMEKILLELHSSCVADNINPVQAESKGTEVRFISEPGSAAAFTSVTEHRIALENGKLIDSSYPSTSGEGEKWHFAEHASHSQILLTNVTATGSTPIFQYYRYVNGNLSSTPQLTSSTESLESKQAEETAEIVVTFTAAPTTSETSGGRSVELSDTAVLRFDPASASGTNEPCQ